MRLRRLKIAKFRAIRSAELNIGDEVALVGQNSAGKTSILRALNAFFNFEEERQSFELGHHRFTPSAFAVIEVTLADVPADCPITRCEAPGEIRARLRYRKTAQWEIHDGHTWLAAPADLHEVLGRYISYVLIPLRRDHGVADGDGGDLVGRAVDAAVLASRQRDRITPQIQRLRERLNSQALDGLVHRLRQLAPLGGEFEFVLEHDRLPDYSMLLQNLSLRVREGNQNVRLADAGSGTQNMAVFALLAYLAEMSGSTYIIGFEEPEQNLHPQAQMQLLAGLRELGLQIVFTTHSPTMIDMLDHEQVVLCRRCKAGVRDIEVEAMQLPSDFFYQNGLDRDKYYKFYRRRNSDFFFADYVLVTESPIDAAVISQVLDDAAIDPIRGGITMLPLDGVTSLPYVFALLRGLKIQSGYVVDRDYFLPYAEGKRANSLDANGYPRYSTSVKPGTILTALLPRTVDRLRMEQRVIAWERGVAHDLAVLGVFCFKWAIEVDLVASPTTRSRLSGAIGVTDPAHSEVRLLIDNQSRIKDQSVLVTAVAGVDARSLPQALREIRSSLKRVVDTRV